MLIQMIIKKIIKYEWIVEKYNENGSSGKTCWVGGYTMGHQGRLVEWVHHGSLVIIQY